MPLVIVRVEFGLKTCIGGVEFYSYALDDQHLLLMESAGQWLRRSGGRFSGDPVRVSVES